MYVSGAKQLDYCLYLRRGAIPEVSDALVLVDLLQEPVRGELDRRRHGLPDLFHNTREGKKKNRVYTNICTYKHGSTEAHRSLGFENYISYVA